MEKIDNVVICDCVNSEYIKPFSVQYDQNGQSNKWDLVNTHDSVAVLLYHSERKSFIFVKQFRPAVYVRNAVMRADQTIDTNVYPGHLGVTHELCAGIMDKDATAVEVARDEVLEECGYRVPLQCMERVTSCKSSVGTSGSNQILFYAEVTDAMREHCGGGLAEEGELIDTVELPVGMGREFLMDETVNKPAGLMFALLWFYDQKYRSVSMDSP